MPNQAISHRDAIESRLSSGRHVVPTGPVGSAEHHREAALAAATARRRRGVALAQWPTPPSDAFDPKGRPAHADVTVHADSILRRRSGEILTGWPTGVIESAVGRSVAVPRAANADARTVGRVSGIDAERSGSNAAFEHPASATLVLAIATTAFTLSFAVWVMFAIVAVPMRAELGFNQGQFALLIALPVLTGSILRVPIGLLTDTVGGRKAMTGLLVATAVPTFLVSRVNGFGQALVLAAFVGTAGSTFAAGASWVSAWQPASRQGFALGVFGVGNVGASITKLIAPALVSLVGAGGVAGGLLPGGWRFVPVFYATLLCVAAVAIFVLAPKQDRRPSRGRSIAQRLMPLGNAQVWLFGLYYVTVFGAYVALALWLPEYMVNVYGLDLVTAGMLTTLFIFPASLLRPVGGLLSDRFGAVSITRVSLSIISASTAALCLPLGVAPFIALVVLTGVAMGVGKASVFALIPQHFPRDVGAAAGLVGAIGGLGGFALPLAFSWTQDAANDARATFAVLLAVALLSIACLAGADTRRKFAIEGVRP